MNFHERLVAGSPVLLDGATGSELEARGADVRLPLWSAACLLDLKGRSLLRTIHADYIRAGAEVITTNTFRTNPRALRTADLEDRAKTLTRAAVDEVRFAIEEAAQSQKIYIAGSVAPVEDCYRPDLVPPDEELYDEHRRHIDHLYEAGTDILLIETMNTIREARTAAAYAKQTDRPVLVSFVCKDEEHLYSGEPLEQAVTEISRLNPTAILVNCARPEVLEKNIEILKDTAKVPIGAYANVLVSEKFKATITPESHEDRVKNWVARFGLRLIGGCCGASPKFIERLVS